MLWPLLSLPPPNTVAVAGRRRREAALLVEQAVVSQRAMRHAAWGAKKDIKSKLQLIKKSPYKAVTKVVHPQEIFPAPPTPRTPSKGGPRTKQDKLQTPRGPSTPAGGRSTISPCMAGSTVLATPTGFKKVRNATSQDTPPRSKTPQQDPSLWKIGEDYGRFYSFI